MSRINRDACAQLSMHAPDPPAATPCVTAGARENRPSTESIISTT